MESTEFKALVDFLVRLQCTINTNQEAIKDTILRGRMEDVYILTRICASLGIDGDELRKEAQEFIEKNWAPFKQHINDENAAAKQVNEIFKDGGRQG